MALEQNEIKKVITVDLGNTTTSLKDYKKHIDELRGSLLQLDETSEEYQKIAQEVTNEQNKLNEVMKVGKTNTDAAEGSYNQLAQTMSELKKQWKATADETERAELGQKILDINNQLKELDASTGNYQRNVGDYANAFEQAFDKCLDGISSIDGPLGAIGGTTKQLLPVIKSINSTALTGLSGIKKAIASTGIGLLVVAVGTLAANWDKVADAIDNATNKNSIYTKQLNETIAKIEEINRKYKEGNQALTDQLKLMASLGATKLEQLKTSKEAAERDKANFEAEVRQNETVIKQLKEKRASIIEANRAASYGATGGGLGADTSAIDKQINALEERNKVLKEGDNDAIEGIDKITQRLHNLTIDIEAETNTQIRIIENSLKSEEQKLTEAYEANKKLLEEQGKDTTALTEKYLKDLAALNDKGSKAITEAKKNSTKDEQEELEKQATTILARVHKSTTDELVLLDETYKKELELLKSLGKDTTELTQEYENNRKKIIETGEKEAYDALKETIDRQHNELAAQISSEQFRLSLLPDEGNELYKAERLHELNVTLLQDQIQNNKDLLDNFSGTEEEKQKLLSETANLERQLEDENLAYAVTVQNIKDKMIEDHRNKVFASITGSASVMADLFGSLSDMAEEGSEEAKALAIMSATINALGSAVGAYKSASEIPYVGWLMGPIAAAAALAAGMAQVQAIRSTNKDSSGSASVAAPKMESPESLMASVNPLIDEQTDINRMTALNEQGDSTKETQNLRVYVVDQDIRDADHKAKVVEDNTTF